MAGRRRSVAAPLTIEDAHRILARIPGWPAAPAARIAPMEGGLTNQSFSIEQNGERFVLRVNGENSNALGIDREGELEALSAAARAGLAPEVIAFLRPEGHLVRRFVAGEVWDNEALRRPEVLCRVLQTLRAVHHLPAIVAEFSPFRDIERRLGTAAALGIPLPDDLGELMAHAGTIEAKLWRRSAAESGLCHNDPFAGNFIVDERHVWLIDWEFGGMGDVYYDLACLSGLLPPEEQSFLLEAYFGAAPPDGLSKLAAMRFLVQLWNWTWALLQTRLSPVDLAHAGMEQRLLESIRAQLPRG